MSFFVILAGVRTENTMKNGLARKRWEKAASDLELPGVGKVF